MLPPPASAHSSTNGVAGSMANTFLAQAYDLDDMVIYCPADTITMRAMLCFVPVLGLC